MRTCTQCTAKGRAGRNQEDGLFMCWVCEWLVKGRLCKRYW